MSHPMKYSKATSASRLRHACLSDVRPHNTSIHYLRPLILAVDVSVNGSLSPRVSRVINWRTVRVYSASPRHRDDQHLLLLFLWFEGISAVVDTQRSSYSEMFTQLITMNILLIFLFTCSCGHSDNLSHSIQHLKSCTIEFSLLRLVHFRVNWVCMFSGSERV